VYGFTWRDTISGQSGAGTTPAGTESFFYVNGYSSSHTVVVSIGGTQQTKATNSTNLCTTKVTVEKRVEGVTAPAGQRFPFEISGETGFGATFDLAGGESREFTVPGTIAAGSIALGQPYPGGYAYRVRELDSFGATVEATNSDFTASKDGKYVATFINRFGVTPSPTPGPQPSPSPQPAPTEADLVLRKTVTPARGNVGDVFSFTVTVTNRGPAPRPTSSGRSRRVRRRPGCRSRSWASRLARRDLQTRRGRSAAASRRSRPERR
jgi:hypothetical protein